MFFIVDMTNSNPPTFAVVRSGADLPTLKQPPFNCLQTTPTNLDNPKPEGKFKVKCNDTGTKMTLTILSQ